jgi:uncharacterized membrane protein
MNSFAIALILFVLLHVGISATGLRTRLVKAIGEGPYRAFFSLASFALLAWLIIAFREMRRDLFDPLNEMVWLPPEELKWPAYALIFAGFVFAVAGLLTPGPTLAGFENSLNKPEPARGVLRITRNPFLWGVAFWAAGHLLINGERFAVMLFGALGAMVLFGARSTDRKGAARNPEAWARFAAATSDAPFAAILQGRNQLKLGELWWRVLLGAAAFFIVGLLHRQFTGVAAFF